MTETKTETIACPNCGTVQEGTITFDDSMPFPCYVHTCVQCGYVIMESEWERVQSAQAGKGEK